MGTAASRTERAPFAPAQDRGSGTELEEAAFTASPPGRPPTKPPLLIGPEGEEFQPTHRFSVRTSKGIEQVAFIFRPLVSAWGDTPLGDPMVLSCMLDGSRMAFDVVFSALRDNRFLAPSREVPQLVKEHFSAERQGSMVDWLRVWARENTGLTPEDIMREVDFSIAKIAIVEQAHTDRESPRLSQTGRSNQQTFEYLHDTWFALLEKYYTLVEEVEVVPSADAATPEVPSSRRLDSWKAVYKWFGETYTSASFTPGEAAVPSDDRIQQLAEGLFAVVGSFWILGTQAKKFSQLYKDTEAFFRTFPPPAKESAT